MVALRPPTRVPWEAPLGIPPRPRLHLGAPALAAAGKQTRCSAGCRDPNLRGRELPSQLHEEGYILNEAHTHTHTGAALRSSALRCALLRCAALFCAALRSSALRCAVQCCAVLWNRKRTPQPAVRHWGSFQRTQGMGTEATEGPEVAPMGTEATVGPELGPMGTKATGAEASGTTAIGGTGPGRSSVVGSRPSVVELSEEPLSVQRYVDLVGSPAAGGIATFLGTTRDSFEGKRVVRLEYQAYHGMAHKKLEELCDRARGKWELCGVAVAHRLGVVPIGEASVIVAVSSVHRREALEACHFLIDELKASVPIWKKEVYEDGHGAEWKANKEFTGAQPAAK